MDELKKFLLAFLVASVGLSKEDANAKIADLEDAAKTDETSKEILASFKAKINDLKKTNFDDGHKKAAKEVKFAFEKDLKEKYGVTSDKTGTELVEEIVAAQTAGSGKGGKDLTDEEIKKHPLFLKLEKDSAKALKDAETNFKADLQKIEDAKATEQLLSEVKSIGIAEFEKLNPVLSPDAEKANKQKARIAKELEGKKYQKVGSDFLILKEDGSRLEDEHGNPVRLSNLVREISDDLGFDYKAATDRSSAGGGANKGQGGGNEGESGNKYTGKMPSNEDELNGLLFDPKVSAEHKTEIQEAWNAQQTK